MQRIFTNPLLQTIFAVSLYILVAYLLDTHLHLIASVIIATFTLFRSNTSIRYARKQFFRYITNDAIITAKSKSVDFYIIFITVLGSILVCIWVVLSLLLLHEHNDLKTFSYGLILAFSVVWLPIFITTAVSGSTAGVLAGIFSGEVARTGAMAVEEYLPRLNARQLLPSISAAVRGAQIGVAFSWIYQFVFFLVYALACFITLSAKDSLILTARGRRLSHRDRRELESWHEKDRTHFQRK